MAVQSMWISKTECCSNSLLILTVQGRHHHSKNVLNHFSNFPFSSSFSVGRLKIIEGPSFCRICWSQSGQSSDSALGDVHCLWTGPVCSQLHSRLLGALASASCHLSLCPLIWKPYLNFPKAFPRANTLSSFPHPTRGDRFFTIQSHQGSP